MPARIEVVKDISDQRIYFKPQEGRPSATPSVALKDRYGSIVAAASTSNVTLDTVNTTVSVAGAKNDMSLTLTAVTGIQVGRSYLITNSLGQKEWFRVYAVNASTKIVESDEKLEFVHDTAATFQSTTFYRTLTDTEVNTLAEMQRARATYTFDSMDYTQEINFDICLTPLINPLTVEFIKKRRPSIMPREPSQTRGSDFADLRESAWDLVKKGIRKKTAGNKIGDKWRPSLLRTPEDVEEWALAEFDVMCFKANINPLKSWDPQAALEHLEDVRRDLKNSSLNDLQFMDKAEDDSPGPEDIGPKQPHLMR